MSLVAEHPPKLPTVPVPEPPGDRPYAITADQFFAMIEAGVFPEEARVYLEDGRILEKMAKTRAHSWTGGKLVTRLSRSTPDAFLVLPEGEFQIDEWNAKLPDVALVRADAPRGPIESRERLNAATILLAVEIAVTSLAKDLGGNLERYARAGIPHYWVADPIGRRLIVHSGPVVVEGRGVYQTFDIIGPGGAFDLRIAGFPPIRFHYEDLME